MFRDLLTPRAHRVLSALQPTWRISRPKGVRAHRLVRFRRWEPRVIVSRFYGRLFFDYIHSTGTGTGTGTERCDEHAQERARNSHGPVVTSRARTHARPLNTIWLAGRNNPHGIHMPRARILADASPIWLAGRNTPTTKYICLIFWMTVFTTGRNLRVSP